MNGCVPDFLAYVNYFAETGSTTEKMPKIITPTLGYNKLNCACVLLSDLS